MRYPIVILVLALAIFGIGCGAQPPAPPAVATATAGPASNPTPTPAASQSNPVIASSTPSPGLTLQSSPGQSITVSGAVPDALKGFPVPDGFALTTDSSGSLTANEGTMAVAEWSGTGTLQSISDFYARTLKQQGWSQQLSMNAANGGTLAYTKGDSQANITIDASDSTTTKVGVMLLRNLATQPAGAAVQATPAPVQLATGGGMPAALSSLPVPNGFTVVPDSTANISSGNQVMSTASWTGSSSVADAAAFYKKSMAAAGWTEVSFLSTDAGFVGAYTSAKDPKVSLVITGSTSDSATQIATVLTTAAQ
jgi:hypothetical protein